MVFYILFYDYLTGHTYSTLEILKFFFQMALGGPALGILFGCIALIWLATGTIKNMQVTVTISLAYIAFFIGENDAKVSGILAVFGGACVMALTAWPFIEHHHVVHAIWHQIEFLGNSVLFLLAGTIMGDFFGKSTASNAIDAHDWGWNFLLYLLLTVIRGLIMVVLFPVMRRLGYGLNWKEAAVMTWGGLRGAVGLALAIMVYNTDEVDEHGEQYISDSVKKYVLFHVSGIALWTLLINGTTCSLLIRKLGMLDTSYAQQKMLANVVHQAHGHMVHEYQELCSMDLFALHDNDFLKKCMQKVLEQIMAGDNMPGIGKFLHSETTRDDTPANLEPCQALTNDGTPLGATVQSTVENWLSERRELEFLVTLRQMLLSAVQAEYWEMIEQKFIPQGRVADKLLATIDLAKDSAHTELCDWSILAKMISGRGALIVPVYDLLRSRVMGRPFSESLSYYRWRDGTYCASAFIVAHEKALRHLMLMKDNSDHHPPWMRSINKVLKQTATSPRGGHRRSRFLAQFSFPEYNLVAEECRKQIGKAQQFLKQASMARQSILRESQTRQLAKLVMHKYEEHVQALTRDGMLTAKNAATLLHDCHHVFSKQLQKYHEVIMRSQSSDAMYDNLKVNFPMDAADRCTLAETFIRTESQHRQTKTETSTSTYIAESDEMLPQQVPVRDISKYEMAEEI
ncbi:hypothetical protein CYMTET_8826 [Cymbomonas tetramitiformis]|uniref:Cation/H+ exchanger domain-containing protein n=1 Tax=Cymbomonas tetramitiformis TaxID=36881 RepID=A0AAE0GU52_9CHLO|nr:hypothetical protein CYMTET_8826 [Cymbomonas tetramitiformis]